MSAGAILSSLDGAVARLVIDRTERGNLLTLDMVTALAAAMRAVPADAKAVHLYGVGADFCRGRDPAGSPATATALDVRARLIEPILSLYEAIAACPIPVVASVNGAARGLGAALAGACDVTIASATARFALPEMEKDLPPTLAISALMRRVPAKPLAYLVLSLDEIDAQTAREIGLVSHVVEGDAVAGAHPFLATLAARSRTALVAVKDYLRAAPEIGPQPRHDLAANLLACVLSSRAS
ncbi:enoyl-CoA hydratase/isomerase family protein [Xanthobacter tagetidis]|uniref:Enoyl-CoA hydratase/isomerase family protein n=1 Tax=Xanthobacter tagetidis TaxID=60216 RepID=A0A3L7AD04_9HYPH|nr:enoyl-CoA hydratase/isomerase family protein [Xanthobacter tagetidis]MBB6306047.1 enoyl-CoA hydratase/carnithine racemase [Xanthobacter tagetidis]RLP77608.1 enoyl-CoA hydratase/isomerase family protein [Xanthobacter tagetidis]